MIQITETRTKKEVAEIFNVKPRTVQQWIQKGWIKAIYKGGAWHIPAEQLEGFQRPKPGPKVS